MSEDGELTLEVTREAGRLAGSAEAAAVLESMGIGDDRAKTLGRANVFRLAADVADEQDRSPAAVALRSEVEAGLRWARVADHRVPGRPVARSVAVAVPVVASLAATTVLTASLWNDGPAGIERATAVGLAAATSLPVAAGFVVAMARPGAGGRLGRGSLRLAAAGLVAAVAAGVGLWLLLSLKALVAPSEVGIVLAYFAALSVLWLACGLTAAAGRVAWVSAALAAGGGLSVGLRVTANASLATAQLAGILVAAAIAFVVVWRATDRGAATVRPRANGPRSGAGRNDDGPRGRDRIRDAGPLVLFGVAFAALVLVAQIATWYSQSPRHRWILALRPDAQAGWAWALVAMLGGIAVVAASARAFGHVVAAAAERTPLTAPGGMTTEIAAARRRTIGRLIAAAIAGAAVSFVAVIGLMAVSESASNVVRKETAFVFAIVGPGLVIAAWAAFDCAVLVTFRRPRAALAGALIGLGVAAVASMLLARIAAGWTAAAGFDAGAVVCWAIARAGARRVVRAPDVALAGRG